MAKKTTTKKKAPSVKSVFAIDKSMPLSEARNQSDNKIVVDLSETLRSLPNDGVSSVFVPLHIAKDKRLAANLILTAKRRLGDEGREFVSRAILNEKKVYQGTRVWRSKKAK